MPPPQHQTTAEELLQTQIIANNDLLNVEEVLMSFLDTTPDAVLLVDHTGSIMRANTSAKRLFQCTSPESLHGKKLVRYLSEARREEFNTLIANARDHKTFDNVTLDMRLRGQQGGQFFVEVSIGSTPLPDVVSIFIRDVTKRKKLEIEVLRVAGDERRLIAADLHDSLCQELTAVHFGVARIQRQPSVRADAKLQSLVETVITMAENTVNHARSIAHSLSPMVTNGGELVSSLGQLASNLTQLHHLPCTFKGSHSEIPMDGETASQLYHIAQEAINNALRHADKATSITVKLTRSAKHTTLSVKDDGKGFDPSATHMGRGMNFMRYRAGILGAYLKVKSAPGRGTEVLCKLPTSSAAQSSTQSQTARPASADQITPGP